MAEAKDKPQDGGEALESGGYEVIRARLVAQGKALAEKTSALNERRKQAFGGSELQVVANERVRTEHACVPADIVQSGGQLLLGYNVFFGMKKEVTIEDVFSIQTFDPAAPEGQAMQPATHDKVPGLLDGEQFVKDFTDIYKYYKDTRLQRLKATDTKLFAIFQIGAATTDVKVLHWNVLPRGGVRYVDTRGDRELPKPASHDFEWTATTREDQVSGPHPHVSIKDLVFVETVGGDLTIKVENNTRDGLGIYREPVEDANQALDDAKFFYAIVGPLVLLKIQPYREQKWRYFIYNTRLKAVARVDAIGQSCMQLPEGHGVVFPGGYYLTTGDTKQFSGETGTFEFERRIDAPNGEDVLYVFYRQDQGRYVLFPYNLIRKEMANPIQCNGYSLFRDGKLVVFRAQSEEQAQLHPMQVWQTPFMTSEFAAAAPTDGSYLAKVGNAELVRGISEAFSVARLIDNSDPRRETYEDLIAQAQRLVDNYYWLGHAEVGDLASDVKTIRQTGELIIDEFEKVVAIRKRAREALQDAQTKQTALVKTLRPGDWKSVEQYMQALTALRNQRGAVITLREVRSIDLAALDVLEKQLVEEFDRISKACVEFLVKGEALIPVGKRLDEVLAKLEKVDNAAQLQPIEQDIAAIGDGLNVLAEVVSGLQVGDAVARTKILEDISTVFAHQGRVRATFQSVRKQLLTSEGKAEFAAQFKLFAQTVSSGLALCDTPEKCDEQLAKLLVQLEELAGRFSEFDEFLGEIAGKREEVHDAFQARKQTLLDERQARVQNLIAAADRILEGVGRRAQTFKTADELNAYFAADAMVLKAKELVDRLMALGASVKGDEIATKITAARQDALRALRDRLELFEEGAQVVKFGTFRFTVNTQVLDLTLVAREGAMAIHLGGTDFYETVEDPEFAKTKDFWAQQLVSETEQVYRGEYLAASVLFAAERGEHGLTVDKLHAAGREAGGLVDVVRKFAAERYDEGYERGLHDSDAALILDKLLAMYATAGLLRVSPGPRALACLFWAWFDRNELKAVWHRRAQSAGRLRAAFGHGAALEALAGDLARAIAEWVQQTGLSFGSGDCHTAGAYLAEELVDERPRFVTSAAAQTLWQELLGALEAGGRRRALDDDLRALEGRLRERFELVKAWLEAFAAALPEQAKGATALVEAAALALTDRKLDREVQTAIESTQVTGLLGQHPRVRERTLELRLDEFLGRLGEFARVRAPGFREFRRLRQQLIDRERKRLRLDEFMPKVLTSFVRNKLVSEVYLPLVGANMAKQLGAAGDQKRTDRMGMLLLISPPGYGKTTLMEYVANRLGLVFMKINGPALGHEVVSIDPAEAPNATAAQEVEKVNLALEMGNNVMLYLDDIQHTNPEFLQKFISLCDAQRRIEGVWRGRSRTYDLRGKKFCVVMAGNPYTESGAAFKIPDMLANRADTYNLGDILGGNLEAFSLSYIENTLTSNRTLAPLATREQADVYRFIKMARGEEVATTDFSYGYSGAEVQEVVGVIKHLFRVQEVLLRVNKEYIASAAMDDKFRTEPAFKLQGSYRNMNKLAEKVAAAMTGDEVDRLVDDHYAGEAQTLTVAAEQNLLKLAEMRGRLQGERAERWSTIKREFQRVRSLGGAADDPAVRVAGQLSVLAERVEQVKDSLLVVAEREAANGKELQQAQMAQQARLVELMAQAQVQAQAQQKPPEPEKKLNTLPMPSVAPPTTGGLDWARPIVARIATALESLNQATLKVDVHNEPPPGVQELLAQQIAIVERTLVPLVRAATGNLQDVRGLQERVDQMLGMLQEIDEILKGKFLR
ncbi:DNA repair ATPase [Nannocystis radixulma]|uniref:DNA repair ATPase n=1 Tax=Nannocystis radixulma TaxID=2995305 RepID=A0ABT5BMZ8_9BACT|nr:DNA repair ATPase [Nannocystis radixulma]MDC0674879.1 DNA repair ATPase [Nannocystis radixulma]